MAVVAERCFPVLDMDRVRFHDTTGRCTVASADAAALGLGVCVLAAPEIVVGAVIVVGVVMVAVAIKEELDAYEFRQLYPEEVTSTVGTRTAQRETLAKRKPQPEPSGQDLLPPLPPRHRERPSRCQPIPVPHRGGDDDHNKCADRIPPNRYPGMDVLVDGKHFDALQVGALVLWEIKTDQFDTYSVFLRNRVVDDQVVEMLEEWNIARACGYGFKIGVSTEAHKKALIRRDDSLPIVVTGCKR
ncbi:DUF6310 domain-containing protein [Corallococcus carmarthensis]|uniref:DUF6310 domain-containing protein n=1 Tax=Corallococcus carmarthensis TaxID=2316728 RepID=UPI002795AB17|nr:DUF6310 domain-containing protein [Corallococcus carmarthensis]